MSSKTKKSLNRIFFCIGFTLCIFPFFANVLFENQVDHLISSFQQENLDTTKEELKKAKKYNQDLFHGQQEYKYEDILNYSSTKVMSVIEIPVISLRLPVYHGVNEEILNMGVGHFPFSSLPAGTPNSHCILTGHRGLPNAKLFTRLDELKIKDQIYIYTCSKKFVYEVDKISIIMPEEIYNLRIERGKDILSLVTCTPYGINTKRLVITAKRIYPTKKQKKKKVRFSYSFRESCFLILPFLILIVGKKVLKT